MSDKEKQEKNTCNFIGNYSAVIWDFDGVIKDSVEVKTQAYEALFLPYGDNHSNSVREHHEANGGMSRFEKIPLYLKNSGLKVTDAKIVDFCNRFSEIVMQGVIDSPYVPGVKEYLEKACSDQLFFLATATPQKEIEVILDSLGLTHCFKKVFGAPVQKADAISRVLSFYDLNAEEVLMVGDASSDMVAAEENSVSFLLRRTPINLHVQKDFQGAQFENLIL